MHDELVMEATDFYDNLDKAQWTSALGLCTPYLDVKTAYIMLPEIVFDMDHLLSEDPAPYEAVKSPTEISHVRVALATQVPLFECPSDNINSIAYPEPKSGVADKTMTIQVPRWDGTRINDTDWAGRVFHLTDGSRVMRTNFVSCIGAHGHLLTPDRKRWRGCMSTRSRVTLDDITDGAAKTIMMAENVGGIFNGKRGVDIVDDDVTRTETSFAWSHFLGGICQGRGNIPYLEARLTQNIAGFGPGDPDPIVPHTIPMLGNSKFSAMRGFGSMHAEGVNVMMADGSVRTLNRAINWQTLYMLCGAADGGTPVDF